jgi:hypothetical protein
MKKNRKRKTIAMNIHSTVKWIICLPLFSYLISLRENTMQHPIAHTAKVKIGTIIIVNNSVCSSMAAGISFINLMML